MAYMYDMMANPEYGYEDEETRRRRLAEQQAQQPATQVAPVAPAQVETVPDAAYTAKMESGGNFNIGRHGANTTATGAYGITAPAFQDVRRRDPYFANKTLEQLTPEEQTRAYGVVRQNNAGYLQNFGVEPNDANLRLAHFLGAKGAADYIKEGKISPDAAKFNGGEENVRRIADARLRGQPAPASGAAQRPQQPQQPVAPVAPEAAAQFQLAQGQGMQGLRMGQAPAAQPPSIDFINTYQTAQDNPQELLKLRSDENAPEFLRRRAADRAYELMDQEVKQRQAQEQVQTLAAGVAQGDPKASREMSKLLQQKEGSWAKYIMLGFISPDLAKEEAIKLGFGNKWQAAQTADGQSGLVEYNAKGLPLRGVKADGTEMDQKELVNYASAGAAGKVATSGTFFQTPTGQILRAQSDDKGNTRLVDAASGARYTGSTQGLASLTEAGGMRRMDRQLTIDLAKKHGQNVLEAEKEYVSLNGPFKTPEERSQFREAYGFSLAQPSAAPGIAPVAQAAPAQTAPAAPRPAAAPAAAPSMAQQAAASRPVAPVQPSPVTVPLAQQQAAAAATKTQATTEAEIVGKDLAEKRVNMGKSESNADYLLTKIDELFVDPRTGKKNPGFEVSVGASVQPGFQFIPGTDKADWYARFDEIKGQQFIQAIDQLKNTGAISDKEGASAKAAISRMNTMQSEAEFKKAAQDFQNIIKRGIDRNRQKLGQEAKYGTKPESELAARDRQALEWANSNPNDPRAAEIKRRLGQ
jgi:hypothetical protein